MDGSLIEIVILWPHLAYKGVTSPHSTFFFRNLSRYWFVVMIHTFNNLNAKISLAFIIIARTEIETKHCHIHVSKAWTQDFIIISYDMVWKVWRRQNDKYLVSQTFFSSCHKTAKYLMTCLLGWQWVLVTIKFHTIIATPVTPIYCLWKDKV